MPILLRLSMIVFASACHLSACGSNESKPAAASEGTTAADKPAPTNEPALPSAANQAQPDTAGDLPPHAVTQYAIVRCVDGFFYDGGYNSGDPVREGLMTDVLALKGLPPYSEALFEKAESNREKMGTAEMLSAQAWCLGESEKIVELAKKRGLEVPAE